MKIIILLSMLMVLTGCTTMGPPYKPAPAPPDGKALIYLMRGSVAYNNIWATTFSLNDTVVVSLYDNGYSWIHVDAGVYKVSAGTHLNNDYLNFMIPVRSGTEHYIEYSQVATGGRYYRNQVRALKAEEARPHIAKYSFKEAEKAVIAKWVPPPAPPRQSAAEELEHVKKIAKQNKCTLTGEPRVTTLETMARIYEVPCEGSTIRFECGDLKKGYSLNQACWLI